MIDLSTKLHFDNENKMVVERAQDCNAIADWCKRQSAAGYVGSGEMKHAAKIPNVMIEAYINTKNISPHEFYANPVHMKAILNDPALADFRIWKGQV